MKTLGPYLIFSNNIPRQWCYFKFENVENNFKIFSHPYFPDIQNPQWVELQPEENSCFYVYDPEEAKPLCFVIQNSALYKIPLKIINDKKIATQVFKPIVDNDNNIRWVGAPILARQLGVNAEDFPDPTLENIIAPEINLSTTLEEDSQDIEELSNVPQFITLPKEFNKLKKSIHNFQKHYENKNAEILIQKIKVCYYQQTLNALVEIFNDPQHDFINRIEAFLAQNWDKYKNTILSNTVLNTQKITLLLVDIAIWLEKEINNHNLPKKTAIQLLMPDVALESRRTEILPVPGCRIAIKYLPTDVITDDDRRQVVELTTILFIYDTESRNFILGYNYDGAYAEKFITPELNNSNEAKKLLCKLVQKQETQITNAKHNAILDDFLQQLEIFITTYPTERAREGYPDLDQVDLKNILKTHILGEDLKHLIPVRIFTELNLEQIGNFQLMNPYVHEEYENNHTAWYLTETEIEKIAKHNAITQELFKLRTEYLELIQKQSGEVYHRILELATTLKENSAHGGRGTSLNAAEGAYPAIIKFNNYYITLSDTSKDSIPQNLRNELELLISLASDPTRNHDATTNIQTCIGIRSERLLYAMQGVSEILNPEELVKKIKTVKSKFHKLQQKLESQILNQQYSGYERHREITLELLNNIGITNILNIPPAINTVRDFRELLQSLNDDLVSLFFNAMMNSWDVCIKSLRDFDLLTNFLPETQIQEVFNVVKDRLLPQITTAKEFKILRPFLTETEINEFLQDFKPKFPHAWADIHYADFFDWIKNQLRPIIASNLEEAWVNNHRSTIHLRLQAYQTWFTVTHLRQLDAEEKEEFIVTEEQLCRNAFRAFCEELITLFIDQIDEFSPGRVMNHLFRLHPWLERCPYSKVVEFFISETFLKRLVQELQPSCNDWSQIPKEYFDAFRARDNNPLRFMQHNFTWNDQIDSEWLDNFALGYPFSDIKKFYIDNKNVEYDLVSYFHNTSGVPEWPSSILTRVAIYRYLYQQFPDQISTFVRDNIVFTHITPKHISELRFLNNNQINYFKTLLINTNTETEPFWMLVHNNDNNWQVFLPTLPAALQSQEIASNEVESIHKLQEFFPDLTVRYIKGKYIHTNDPDLNTNALRQLFLLARILPALHNAPNTIENYRANIPVGILLEFILQEIFKDNYVPKAFQFSAPFSNNHCDPIGIYVEEQINTLFNKSEFFNPNRAKEIVFAFDTGRLIFEPTKNELRVIADKAEEIINAMYLVYKYNISRLYLKLEDVNASVKFPLFSYDCNLLTVKNLDAEQQTNFILGYASINSARNRFLSTVYPQFSDIVKQDTLYRQQLWELSSTKLIEFFQTTKFSPFDIKILKKYKEKWINSYCDHQAKGLIPQRFWALLQIPQMANTGLNWFFQKLHDLYIDNWDEIQQKAPCLHAVFDLTGFNIYKKPEKYTAYLTHKIQSFAKDKFHIAPLFNSIALLLPETEDLTEEFFTQLFKLICTLNIRVYQNQKEPDEVLLYNLDINNKYGKDFFTLLTNVADDKKFILTIRVPEWDKQPTSHLYSLYKHIQNKTRDNYRAMYGLNLPVQTESIHPYLNNGLHPNIIINNRVIYNFVSLTNDKETWYPITLQTPDIQYQNEHQHQHEQEQQQQQEHSFEQTPDFEDEENEPVPIPVNYDKEEDRLITRENIVEKYKKLCPEIEENLYSLFNTWVGSDSNGCEIVEKIEPEAISEILKFKSQFCMGINKDNLPAGFYLAYSNFNHSLILCYCAELKQEALYKQKQLPKKLINVYKLELLEPKPINLFRGDFRQLDIFPNLNAEQKQILWETLVPQNEQINPELEVNTDNVLDILHTISYHLVVSDELREILFNKNSTIKFNIKNFKAFGQLINQYEAKNTNLESLKKFFFILNNIYIAHGAKNFQIFKEYYLDKLTNFSELLEKSEFDTLLLSIVTLENLTSEKDIFWQILKSQSQNNETVRFSQLWNVFESLLKILDQRKLYFNADSFQKMCESLQGFNAFIFFDRLKFVITKFCKENQGREICQDILNNLEKISWQHNGLYYACRYSNYHYWDEDLKLADFYSTATFNSFYEVNWVLNEAIQDVYVHALRFAALKGHLSFSEFKEFKKLLLELNHNIDLKTEENLLSLRYLLISIARGNDSLETIANLDLKKCFNTQISDLNILNYISSKLSLDESLEPDAINISFKDTISIINILKKFPQLLFVFESSEKDILNFLNSCGRIFNWYESFSNDPSKLDKIFTFAINNGLRHPAFIYYPWLIIDNKFTVIQIVKNPFRSTKQIQEFFTQLISINFHESTFLPAAEDIEEALQRIKLSTNRSEEVQRVFSAWQDAGLVVNYSDSAFRQLSKEDIKTAIDYLERNLIWNFKKDNLALVKRLLIKNLCVTKDNADFEIRNFLELLTFLDNKNHYNELGLILSVLLTQAKKEQGKYYLVHKLTLYIKSLVCNQYEVEHYPINLLEDILTFSPDKLLHKNLHTLNNEVAAETISQIQKISSVNLPNKCQRTLLYLIFKNIHQDYLVFAQETLLKLVRLNASDYFIEAAGKLIEYLSEPVQQRSSYREIIEIFTQTHTHFYPENHWSKHLWEQTQVKLINTLIEQISQMEQGLPFFVWCTDPFYPTSPAEYYKKIIMTRIIIFPLPGFFSDIYAKLSDYSLKDLEVLAKYFETPPYPNAYELLNLLTGSTQHNSKLAYRLLGHDNVPAPEYTKFVTASAVKLIDYYETVFLAQTDNQQWKRDFSLTKSDQENLIRVLNGIKLKSQGIISEVKKQTLVNLLYYLNSYALISQLSVLNKEEINQYIHKNVTKIADTTGFTQIQYKARLLACLREVFLRQTGKWVNHTQMLVLIYAALENDQESIIYQIKTGEGKSIISAIRAAYLALNGYLVDIFSAKESLSKRDQQSCAAFLNYLSIRNSYIDVYSDPATYYDETVNNIGAIHFATPGNFSLFISNCIWSIQNRINLHPDKRIAFVDEIDNLLDERTQFNYSDNSDNGGIYNFNEWVYRATYEFYLQNKDKFHYDANQVIWVSNKYHLKMLCDFLIERSINAPPQSNFINKFIIPALKHGDAELITKRDNQLRLLLTACHIASNLKEDVNYCIRPESKTINTMQIETHFAKVLIDNQIVENSTYSDLVHQFLHVRANHEASLRGEKPDFFVEPVSEIALTQNARYVLSKYYFKREGCTGTAGNKENFAYYSSVFNINKIIKIPSHYENKTEILPIRYCDSEDEQIFNIKNTIEQFGDRPILITCKDDIEVKRFVKLLTEQHPIDPDLKLIIDTNDSGKSENEVIPLTEAPATITLSSRMGRGTDIQPKTYKGLLVIRTYPNIARIVKQEFGRQGRNGSFGTCIEILNYASIELEFNDYAKTYPTEIKQMLAQEEKSYNKKCFKYADSTTQTEKSFYVSNKKRFLITRTVVNFSYKLKLEKYMYIERKNYLCAEMTGEVMRVLSSYIDSDIQAHHTLREIWVNTLKKINTLWETRLINRAQDNEEVFNEFIFLVKGAWEELCDKDTNLNKSLIDSIDFNIVCENIIFEDENNEHLAETEVILEFYRWWLEGAQDAYFHGNAIAPSDVINQVFAGKTLKGLDYYFKVFQTIANGEKQYHFQRAMLFSTLKDVMDYQSGFKIYLQTFVYITALMTQKFEHPYYLSYLNLFLHFFQQSFLNAEPALISNSEFIQKTSILFEMLMKIITNSSIECDLDEEAYRQFIENFCDIIYTNYWQELDANFASRFNLTDVELNRALILNLNKISLENIIESINTSEKFIGEIEGAACRDAVVNYLSANLKQVETMPEVLPVMFKFFLNGQQDVQKIIELPNIDIISEDCYENNLIFWHFISQRSPVEPETVKAFAEYIKNYAASNPENLQDFLNTLKELPPYISLEYIYENLKDISNTLEISYRLELIYQAGHEFCEFLSNKHLISSPKEYIYPIAENLYFYNSFRNIFGDILVKHNIILFNCLNNYTHFNHHTLEAIAHAFHDNPEINQNKLNYMCSLLDELSIFPPEIRDIAFEFLQNEPLELTQGNNTFPSFINLLMRNEVFNLYMPVSAIITLWQACREGQINTGQDLLKCIKVIGLAMQLQAKQNWNKYFSTHTNSSETHVRITILQHLQHNLLNIGEDFKNRAFRERDILYRRIFENNSTANNLRTEKHRLKNVLHLLEEIKRIDSHPYSQQEIDAENAYATLTHSLDNTFIYPKIARYRSKWSISSTRYEQCQNLINSINSATEILRTDVDCYKTILNAVLQIQRNILLTDTIDYRFTTCCHTFSFTKDQNTKGYSRLYNLCNEIFYHFIFKYLRHPDILLQDKKWIDDILQEQLIMVTQNLYTALPLCPLKTALQELRARTENFEEICDRNSTEFIALKEAVQNFERNVPRGKRFWVQELKNVLELIDAIKLEDEPYLQNVNNL